MHLTAPVRHILGLALLLGLWLCVASPADTVSVEPITAPLKDARIEVFKEQRKLLLYSGDSLVRVYRIGLGFHPKGHKKKEGDGATPEGEYFVCIKNPQSQYYLSVGLNYPNSNDAAVGLRDGLISRDEHDSIVEAERRGRRPSWDTKLGGEIFIHGNGSDEDWTWGCVALDDLNMKELYEAVSLGTKVVIHP